MTINDYPERTWDVLLIGGASGTGKTSISYRLARHFGVGITEVDDFQQLLTRMTTPEQQPALHFWRTHPDPFSLTPEQMVENLIAIGTAMQPGLEAVIANHLESHAPIVLEGDFITPALAALERYGDEVNNGRVKGIILIEPDELQLRRNYLLREPEAGEQVKRARSSWLYNQWLVQEAAKVGVATVEARPWGDVLERIINTI